MSHIEQIILSRHSVRKYEPGAVIPDADLTRILELAVSAPSSWNLQHWRFLVIREEANKQKLLSLAYNQQQVVDASAVIIVLGDLQANLVTADVYANAAPEVRDMMTSQVNGAYAGNPQIARDEAIRNGSLAAMQLMLAAKTLGYDTVPMGGYDAAGVVREFGIPDRYIPVVMIPIGKAAQPGRPTGRLPLDQVTIYERF